MPKGLMDQLEAIAKEKEIPMNTLITQILTKYVTFDSFIQETHPVVFARATVLSLIKNRVKEELEQAGRESGSIVLKSIFAHHNIKPTLNSIMTYYIEPMKKYSGWFSAKYYAEDKKIAYRHDMGIGWSYFLKGHEGANFSSMLTFEPKIDVTESSVILRL